MAAEQSARPLPNRRTVRYRQFDYTTPGAYFITICAHKGRAVFGEIREHVCEYSPLGQLAEHYWRHVPAHHSYVILDEHVIMPNHVHLLFWLEEAADLAGLAGETVQEDTTCRVPTQEKVRQFGGLDAGSVSTVIGSYKATVTREAKRRGLAIAHPIWQARFWDRIVRTEKELTYIREYIRNNPRHWEEDQLHPAAPPHHFNRWSP